MYVLQFVCGCVLFSLRKEEEEGPFLQVRLRQGSFGGAILRGQGLAGNWVLTELLPHGPTPTDHVSRHRVVAATIAASRLSPWPLWGGEWNRFHSDESQNSQIDIFKVY